VKAIRFRKVREPLKSCDLPVPNPCPVQILIRISKCGICRTDLHVCDGDLKQPKLPLVLDHEIVGKVGDAVEDLLPGQRV